MYKALNIFTQKESLLVVLFYIKYFMDDKTINTEWTKVRYCFTHRMEISVQHVSYIELMPIINIHTDKKLRDKKLRDKKLKDKKK